MSIINTIYKKWLVVISLIVMCVPCGAATGLLTDSVEVDSTSEILKQDSAMVSEMIMSTASRK